ncbi:Hypothetical predicted protein [Mytilus galloprovincialis]|uniref:SWIM-type domain-containing protein n=1 Tax=Mytilus galloprovincialis TaxID=29158 RepID=A0A8B6FV34_MYTGA|nr:Hypothetical predicted protein [Mytilus galloprovincialis]
MSAAMDNNVSQFERMHVPDLKTFLTKRGITCSLYRKQQLVRLCEIAVELQLEVTQTQDDYKDMDSFRRTVEVNGAKYVLPEITTVLNWKSDLRDLPLIESYDILIYLMKVGQWNESRLSNYRRDNGFNLYTSNHIHDVKLHRLINTEYFYVRAACVPETRQSENPYNPWVIVGTEGHFRSGGCTCVVDNGTCKHITALLFSLENFSSRHRDRNTEVGTDVPCTWDRARKLSEPLTINKIDIRNNPSSSLPVEPHSSHYTPSKGLKLSEHEIEKRVFNLCKINKSVFSHILENSSDESDGEVEIPMSMKQLADKSKDNGSNFLDFIKLYHDDDIIHQIQARTSGQAENPEWFFYRVGRITASLFHSVLHYKFGDVKDNYILRNILQQNNKISTPAMKYGIINEPIARHLYFQNYKKKTINVLKYLYVVFMYLKLIHF